MKSVVEQIKAKQRDLDVVDTVLRVSSKQRVGGDPEAYDRRMELIREIESLKVQLRVAIKDLVGVEANDFAYMLLD